jgi:hypothetical protein
MRLNGFIHKQIIMIMLKAYSYKRIRCYKKCVKIYIYELLIKF